ncbi:ribose-phosphate diphosphokinase [Malassezia vespertilionis]|uniref:ribose-phosphate diphosphokinase n=1 Tax=Malassezia vespertilionis TaxID=2020962 RepID=UPI0024B1BDB0|nr:ribose-phosphate diphosphokinase [Malassezia vespertilionis]WFD04975.1 ribose-phosphate diphosphokinase [Malassezia vespertilionis]
MPGVNTIKLLTGNSSPEMAALVLGVPLTECICRKFADQSIDVRIGSSVRDQDVFVIQTGYSPFVDTNDALMELLIIMDACKTASARRITAVIPCFPYARQNKKDKSRAPITAKLVANMIMTAGADHVITVDLHASQIQGFFDIPVDNLTCEPSIARWIRSKVDDWRDAIIVSPDAGGAKRTTSIADFLGIEFALINRRREQAQSRRLRVQSIEGKHSDLSSSTFSEIANGVHTLSESGEWFIQEEGGRRLRSGGRKLAEDIASEDENDVKLEVLVGDVAGKTAILVDDMIDTGRTFALAYKTLEAAGVKRVFAIASHGLLSKNAMQLVRHLNLEKLVVTNTVENDGRVFESGGKLEILDMSAVIGETIRRSHHGESISTMFRQDAEVMF